MPVTRTQERDFLMGQIETLSASLTRTRNALETARMALEDEFCCCDALFAAKCLRCQALDAIDKVRNA